jgi:hypothetical protein
MILGLGRPIRFTEFVEMKMQPALRALGLLKALALIDGARPQRNGLVKPTLV